jgi:hypothetical protein
MARRQTCKPFQSEQKKTKAIAYFRRQVFLWIAFKDAVRSGCFMAESTPTHGPINENFRSDCSAVAGPLAGQVRRHVGFAARLPLCDDFSSPEGGSA